MMKGREITSAALMGVQVMGGGEEVVCQDEEDWMARWRDGWEWREDEGECFSGST